MYTVCSDHGALTHTDWKHFKGQMVIEFTYTFSCFILHYKTYDSSKLYKIVHEAARRLLLLCIN